VPTDRYLDVINNSILNPKAYMLLHFLYVLKLLRIAAEIETSMVKKPPNVSAKQKPL
jgi:hypothetical protein